MPQLVHVHPLDLTVLYHRAVVHEFNRRAADVQLLPEPAVGGGRLR